MFHNIYNIYITLHNIHSYIMYVITFYIYILCNNVNYVTYIHIYVQQCHINNTSRLWKNVYYATHIRPICNNLECICTYMCNMDMYST